MGNITQVQQHHLNLIRCIDFNSFDGQVVANGLLAHSGKWVAVIVRAWWD